MNDAKVRKASSSQMASGRNPTGIALEQNAACEDSPMCIAFSQQRDQMERLLSALQNLENRLSPVLMGSSTGCLKREECPSRGSSLLVVEIEQTTHRLEDYTDKVNTIISMLEI